jgi:hypothetical protein
MSSCNAVDVKGRWFFWFDDADQPFVLMYRRTNSGAGSLDARWRCVRSCFPGQGVVSTSGSVDTSTELRRTPGSAYWLLFLKVNGVDDELVLT